MSARAGVRLAPLRPEDRWRFGENGPRVSSIALVLVVVSLAVHGLILAVAMLGAHAEAVPPTEIPVEIVEEAPAPRKPAPKPAAQTPTTPPSEPAAAKPASDPAAEHAAEHADLAKQLAALEAEKAALADDRSGLGPLKDSIRAVALPSVAADGEDGDLTSYQALVFSRLARAKASFPQLGRAGTAGVRFSVDDDGRLVEASLAVSSGSRALDDEALAIVRAAAPFPKPPAGAEREFSANVAYAAVAR